MSPHLVFYGDPPSERTRTVYWPVCRSVRLCDLVGTSGAGYSELARLNPKAQIPAVIDGNFVLYEMPGLPFSAMPNRDNRVTPVPPPLSPVMLPILEQ